MKNSVLLIDTNILLNYLTNRVDPYLEQSVEIVRKCAAGECTGYIAFHTPSTLWYVLRKRSDRERRQNLKKILLQISRIVCRINAQRMSAQITLSPVM